MFSCTSILGKEFSLDILILHGSPLDLCVIREGEIKLAHYPRKIIYHYEEQ